MTLHQMRIIHYLVETQSYSAAAEKLFLAQSSVSAQVKTFETSLGLKLIDREASSKARGIVLTEEGAVVYESIKIILSECDKVNSFSQQVRVGNKQKIRLLANSPTASYMIPALLSRYVQSDPITQFKLITRTDYSELKRLVKSNCYDVCIMPHFHDIPEQDIVYTFDIPIVLVTNNVSRRPCKKVSFFDNGRDFPFKSVLLPSTNSAPHEFLQLFFTREKIRLDNATEVDHSATIKKILTSSPCHCALVSLLTVQEELDAKVFQRLETDPEMPTVPYVVVRHPSKHKALQIDMFLECLREYLDASFIGKYKAPCCQSQEKQH